MQVIPAARAVRFEQLEPGELFLFVEGSVYALKTLPRQQGDRAQMLLLGPTVKGGAGAQLYEWQAATVLTLGRNFAILLPTEACVWAPRPGHPAQVWLALAEDRIFIYANLGPSPQYFVAGFVDIRTGQIVEHFQDSALFTNTWEIAVVDTHHPPRTVVKFPLQEAE